ncbi:MAG: hypothetical protein C0413_02470 [Clostridiales bacterium]|nr:hypothetical protein [Clostridiales bacterium]
MKKLFSQFIAVFLLLVAFFPSKSLAHDTERADDGDYFTIVWVSDTQDIAYRNRGDVLEKMGKWIIRNRDLLRIRFVVQTGDAVDNGASPWQWEAYDHLLKPFRGRIPYIAAAGNHEIKKNGFLEFCMREDVRSIPRSQTIDRGKASFATFTVKDEKFIIVSVGFGVELHYADWMNQVLKTYKDHTAILILHDYLAVTGNFSITGKQVFQQVVVPNPNVRLVLCGHVTSLKARADVVDDDGDGTPDRVVNGLLYDYQHYKEDFGQIRWLRFDLKHRSITVTTYSPFTKRYYKDFNFDNQAIFTITNAF